MNEDGLAASVTWRWHWVEAGTVVPAPADLVQLLITEFVVRFGPPGGDAEGWGFAQPRTCPVPFAPHCRVYSATVIRFRPASFAW